MTDFTKTKEINMKKTTSMLLAVMLINGMAYAEEKKGKAIEAVKDVAGNVASVTQQTKGYTETVAAGYKTKMDELKADRQTAKQNIDKAKGDSVKQRELAIGFYKKQQAILTDMHEDAIYTSKKMEDFYRTMRTAVGGYGTAEGKLSREATEFQNKKALVKEQARLKNDATALLAEKRALPKDNKGNIDESTDEYFAFADKEDALIEKYEDAANEIRRSERKLRHYQAVANALELHKGAALKYTRRARALNRKYRSLVKDLVTQMEIVEEMIAITDLGRQIAEMGKYEKIAGEIDIILGEIDKMGFLTKITIEGGGGDDDDKLKGITLEAIVEGDSGGTSKATPADTKEATNKKK